MAINSRSWEDVEIRNIVLFSFRGIGHWRAVLRAFVNFCRTPFYAILRAEFPH